MGVRLAYNAERGLQEQLAVGGVISSYSVILTVVGTALHFLLASRSKSAVGSIAVKMLVVCLLLTIAAMPEVFLAYYTADSTMALFFLAAYSVTGCFKAFEAAVGTSPAGTRDTLGAWLLYFVSPVEPQFAPLKDDTEPAVDGDGSKAKLGGNDNGSSAATPEKNLKNLSSGNGDGDSAAAARKNLQLQDAPSRNGKMAYAGQVRRTGKPLAAAPGATLYHLRQMALFLFINCALLSVGARHAFQPWESLYLNTILQGSIVYGILEFFTNLLAVPLTLYGVAPVKVMRNPMLASTSPRDLWGRRWNMVIHRLLARTYFTPLARRGGFLWRTAGATLTFVMSGLFHEFIWHIVLRKHQKVYGEVTAFFVAQLVICTAQSLLEHCLPGLCRRWNGVAPAVAKTAITWACVFPFGHLFTVNMVRGNVFERFLHFFPYLAWDA